MRASLVVVVLAACTSNLPPAASRWPNHRRLHDERIDKLEQQQLDERVRALERRVHELEAKLAVPPPQQMKPAEPPVGTNALSP